MSDGTFSFPFGDGEEDEPLSFSSPGEMLNHAIESIPPNVLEHSISINAVMLALKNGTTPRQVLADALARTADTDQWNLIQKPKLLLSMRAEAQEAPEQPSADPGSHDGGVISPQDAADLRALFGDGS